MSTARQAIRRRRQARMDPRYIGTRRKDAGVRSAKARAKVEAEWQRQQRAKK